MSSPKIPATRPELLALSHSVKIETHPPGDPGEGQVSPTWVSRRLTVGEFDP
jgi:hypothetical protein